MAKTEGLAAAASTIANVLLEKDREKRAFRQKLQTALFERDIKSGRIREPKPGETADVEYGGFGFKRVSPEEIALEQAATQKRIQGMLPSGYLSVPSFDVAGNVSGYSSQREREGGNLTREAAIKLMLDREKFVRLPPHIQTFIQSRANEGLPAMAPPPPAPSAPPAQAGVPDMPSMLGLGLRGGRVLGEKVRSFLGGGNMGVSAPVLQAPSPAPSPAGIAPYQVGQIVEKGGRKWRIAGFDKDGTPLVEPVS